MVSRDKVMDLLRGVVLTNFRGPAPRRSDCESTLQTRAGSVLKNLQIP